MMNGLPAKTDAVRPSLRSTRARDQMLTDNINPKEQTKTKTFSGWQAKGKRTKRRIENGVKRKYSRLISGWAKMNNIADAGAVGDVDADAGAGEVAGEVADGDEAEVVIVEDGAKTEVAIVEDGATEVAIVEGGAVVISAEDALGAPSEVVRAEVDRPAVDSNIPASRSIIKSSSPLCKLASRSFTN